LITKFAGVIRPKPAALRALSRSRTGSASIQTAPGSNEQGLRVRPKGARGLTDMKRNSRREVNSALPAETGKQS
jgi:hypothetical protein